LCLEGKLRCLQGLPQRGRQDEKHVRLATLIVREFLKEQLPEMNTRSGLNLVERVARGAWSEGGLHAWYKHRIQIEAAVPIVSIESLPDPRWQQFLSIRAPQLHEQLQQRRRQYQHVMAHIEERRTQKQQTSEQDY